MRQTYREAFHRCIPRSYDAKRNASASGLRGPAGVGRNRPAAPERKDLQEPFMDPGVLRNRSMAGGWRLTQRAKGTHNDYSYFQFWVQVNIEPEL